MSREHRTTWRLESRQLPQVTRWPVVVVVAREILRCPRAKPHIVAKALKPEPKC